MRISRGLFKKSLLADVPLDDRLFDPRHFGELHWVKYLQKLMDLLIESGAFKISEAVSLLEWSVVKKIDHFVFQVNSP
jgi:hypothetical protein